MFCVKLEFYGTILYINKPTNSLAERTWGQTDCKTFGMAPNCHNYPNLPSHCFVWVSDVFVT